jgi:hypothetical protein
MAINPLGAMPCFSNALVVRSAALAAPAVSTGSVRDRSTLQRACYDTLPIAYFEPMLRRVFAVPKWTECGA